MCNDIYYVIKIIAFKNHEQVDIMFVDKFTIDIVKC